MGIRKLLIMLPLLILVIPPSVLAEGRKIESGFDLYSNLKKLDNPQNPEDLNTAMHTIGYLSGYLDGMVYMQTILFNKVFPKDALTEKQRDKISGEINFNRVNFPKNGLPTGQLILIYKKYAEKHPEQLSNSARCCLFESIIEAYGWK